MKSSTTAQRLRQIMEERGLRQVDLLKLVEPYCRQYGVKMNKSNLSQYVNGTNEPQQDKLFILGIALDVSEGWLMGYDVSKDRQSDADRFASFADAYNIAHPNLMSMRDKLHMDKYRQLSDEYKDKVDALTQALLSAQATEEDLLLAAHARIDISQDPADVASDIEMMKKNGQD